MICRVSPITSYGPFAIEKKETAKKFFFELIVILNIFQPKNHICHININFIFLAVSPLSIAKSSFGTVLILIKTHKIVFVSIFINAFLRNLLIITLYIN